MEPKAPMPEPDDDLLTPERTADPYPHFAWLRANDPVRWNELYHAWFVHRYDDVVAALRDPRLSSDRVRPVFANRLTPEQQAQRAPAYRILENWMVFRDPPDHTRLRGLVSRAFTPKSAEAQRKRIKRVVDRMLDSVVERGEIDLINDFAFPIPAFVIAEMMGVPPEERDLFKAWSDDVMVLVFGAHGLADRRERAQQGLLDLAEYIGNLVAEFRQRPGSNLISALLDAQEGDQRLTDDEIVATCILLLFGGHETTTNLIGNGTRALLRNPAELERLRSDTGLMKGAVEELLRFDGPSKMEVRIAATDLEMRGKRIRRGDMVYLVQAAANHDPDAFPVPDSLRVDRNPRNHVGFGFGIHYCLGAPLARLEGRIALEALVTSPFELSLTGEERWHPTLISRGMQQLGVAFAPARTR
jgi:cytochrome P450